MNTSRIANASRITVSRSDVKILINRLRSVASIGVVCRLDEFYESIFLLRDDLPVAHQLVKPCMAVLRDDCADETRRFAGLGIRADKINNSIRATNDINSIFIWKQISFRKWREPKLSAPAIYVCQKTTAIARERTDIDLRRRAVRARDGKLGDEKFWRW